MIRRIIPCLLTALVFACSHEPAIETAARATPTVHTTIPAGAPLVVFLGDSLAAGLHLSTDEAFPAVLQRTLAEEGHPFRLVNAGVSGDTTSGGLSRIDWLLKQKPDVLVVELGGNDGLRGEDVALVESNLRRIVKRAQDAGVHVLLIGMRLPPSYGEPYVSEFAGAYTRVARETNVAFVPEFLRGVGGVVEMNLPDGLHPTTKGHEALAANIAPALKALLEQIEPAKR
jgi:acyl-CoA thioesterase-1